MPVHTLAGDTLCVLGSTIRRVYKGALVSVPFASLCRLGARSMQVPGACSHGRLHTTSLTSVGGFQAGPSPRTVAFVAPIRLQECSSLQGAAAAPAYSPGSQAMQSGWRCTGTSFASLQAARYGVRAGAKRSDTDLPAAAVDALPKDLRLPTHCCGCGIKLQLTDAKAPG